MNDVRPFSTPPVKVLYIGGCGRSGSTLLDRMLGQVPGVCSLGEVAHLWRSLLDGDECGCGAPLHDCAFWAAVGDRAFGGWDRVDAAAIRRLQRSVVRQRYVPFMLAPATWPAYRRRLDRYARVLGNLYRGVQAVSGAKLLVDSTKHYSNALVRRHAGHVDLRVVHLVRDSRGVAFSWRKTVARPEAIHRGAPMNRYGSVRSAARWLGYNASFEALAPVALRSLRVRYEDLVRMPDAEIARILAHADVDAGRNGLSFIQGHAVHLRANHTVAGNPMRFRTGDLHLRLDEQWRTELPPRRRRLVAFLTWPLLLRYRYPLRIDGGPADPMQSHRLRARAA